MECDAFDLPAEVTAVTAQRAGKAPSQHSGRAEKASSAVQPAGVLGVPRGESQGGQTSPTDTKPPKKDPCERLGAPGDAGCEARSYSEHDGTVAAIVLNWNSASDTVKCVEAVERSTHRQLKIVMVDNGSADESERALRSYSRGRYPVLQTGDNLGYAAGNQVGVKWALAQGADFVWIINPDCIVRRDTLAKLLAAVSRHGTRAIYCPLLLSLSNPERVYYAGGRFRSKNGFMKGSHGMPLADNPHLLVERVTDLAHGANLLVPAEVIQQRGFMSDEFFLYFEEVDYSLRLAKQGISTIVVPTAVALHKGSAIREDASSRQDRIRQYYRIRNPFLYWRRNVDSASLRQYTWKYVRRELRFYRQQLRAGRLPHRYRVIGLLHGLLGKYGRTYRLR